MYSSDWRQPKHFSGSETQSHFKNTGGVQQASEPADRPSLNEMAYGRRGKRLRGGAYRKRVRG